MVRAKPATGQAITPTWIGKHEATEHRRALEHASTGQAPHNRQRRNPPSRRTRLFAKGARTQSEDHEPQSGKLHNQAILSGTPHKTTVQDRTSNPNPDERREAKPGDTSHTAQSHHPTRQSQQQSHARRRGHLHRQTGTRQSHGHLRDLCTPPAVTLRTPPGHEANAVTLWTHRQPGTGGRLQSGI